VIQPLTIRSGRRPLRSGGIWCVAALALAAASLAASATIARAAGEVEPFKGKTVTVYIGNPTGGGYDVYGRLLARHLGRHIPGNPAVVASNMVGAQSLLCANFIYNVAPHDGTAIGLLEENIAADQIYHTDGARFDATKFAWIGRMDSSLNTLLVWHSVPVRSIEDVKSRETIFAGDSPSGYIYPTMLNAMIGTRFKIIRGFPGTQAALLALERGEAEAVSGSPATLRARFPDLLRDHKVRFIVQDALERSPELPEVPAVVEFAPTRADKEVLGFFASGGRIGRSFVLPPGVDPERVRILREAFDATMRDPQLLAEARQMNVDLDPLPGADVQQIVEHSLALSEEARERARQFPYR
jgi:tripartite-type tricarboxylate transporter receptor subunit TctC